MHFGCDVGVGAEGEASVIVTQDAGDGFHVDAVLQRQGREGIPSVKNREKTHENTNLYWQSPLENGKFNKQNTNI